MQHLPDEWASALISKLTLPYIQPLEEFVRGERARHTVFPRSADTFRALKLTAPANVRVLVLGQDPYHGIGQANGLCFSVPRGVRVPPSLRNIYKELHADLGVKTPSHGDLSSWAAQGVLLLNTVLTVREGEPGSHKDQGWERFTDSIIRTLSARAEPVVFLLWGNYARRKAPLIAPHHRVVEGAHPSPLSASRGFYGSRPFSAVNEHLRAVGRPPISWTLPESP